MLQTGVQRSRSLLKEPYSKIASAAMKTLVSIMFLIGYGNCNYKITKDIKQKVTSLNKSILRMTLTFDLTHNIPLPSGEVATSRNKSSGYFLQNGTKKPSENKGCNKVQKKAPFRTNIASRGQQI